MSTLALARMSEASEDTRGGRSIAVGWALGPQGEFERRVQAGQIVGGDCQQASALSALQRLRDRLLGESIGVNRPEHVSELNSTRRTDAYVCTYTAALGEARPC